MEQIVEPMLVNCQEQLEVVGGRVVPVLRARKPERLSHFKGVSTGLCVVMRHRENRLFRINQLRQRHCAVSAGPVIVNEVTHVLSARQ